MDVTCERCGTEYDFDETLVSERGTTVKCTNCGHLFKVFRPGAQGAEAAGPRPWAIRRRDGATETLSTLRDLQRRITEGGLSPEDLISRSGEGWKRLGDIAELETFFQAAQAAATAAAPRRRDQTASGFTGAKPAQAPFGHAPSSRPGPPDPKTDPRALAPTQEMEPPMPPAPSRGSGARSLPEPPRTAPPARSATTPGFGSTPPPSLAATNAAGIRKRTMIGVGADSVPPPPARATASTAATVPAGYAAATAPATPAARAIPPTAEYPTEEVEKYKAAYLAKQAGSPTLPDGGRVPPQGRAQARTVEELPPFEPSQARQPTQRTARLRVEEDDIDALPAKRGNAGKIALVLGLIVVVLGGGLALGWSKIGPALGLTNADDPAAQFLTRGDELLASDATSAFGPAITEYTKALAFRERDPRVLVALARAHAVWAQALLFDAQDLSARTADPTAQGEATRVRQEQRSHAAEALRFAEDAVRQSPADVDAELALADAQRLSGDPRGARQHYDRAHTLVPDTSAEGLRIGALLTAAEAGPTSLAPARDLAAAAVAKDPTLLRARLVLARALLEASDISGATTQIDAILARSAQHERALGLRNAIAHGEPPAAPVVAVAEVVDAGAAIPEVAVVPSDLPTGVVPPAVVPAAVAAGGGTEAVPAGRDYSYYAERGELLLVGGRVAQARQFFEAALRARPDGREALTGLGYVAMEQGDTALAIERFRIPAAGGYGDAIIGIAEAHRNSHHAPQAIAAYREYLERFPTGKDARMARNALDQLEAAQPATPPAGGGGDNPGNGGGGNNGGGEPAPPTRPDELPAPVGTTTAPPTSDTPAVGTER